MKHYYFILLILLIHHSFILGVSKTVDNLQAQMVGARYAALGVTNPIIPGDINGVLINPATLGYVESMPGAISHKKILGKFDYKLINFGRPINIRLKLRKDSERLQRLILGASFGTYSLTGIPRTIENNGQFWSDGSYSGGTQIGALSAATAFYDWFGFHTISAGTSLKYMRQFTGSDHGSTLGLDTGLMASKHISVPKVDQVHFGLAIHNALAPAITFKNSRNKSIIPLKIYSGAKVDMFNETLSTYINNSIDGISFGAEYLLQNNIILRGSTTFKTYSLGTGVVFEKIATGFSDRDYSLRFDYAYTVHEAPMNNDPTHTFSISVLGDSRPHAPRILTPETDFLITDQYTIDLAGLGPKNTTIRVYENDAMVRTTATNKVGKWTSNNLPLNPGKNLIYVQSYSLDKDISLESYPIMVYSDTQVPEFNVSIQPSPEYLSITLDINEDVTNIDARINNQNIQFEKEESHSETPSLDPINNYTQPSKWTATIKTPAELKPLARIQKEMNTLYLQLEDLAGNKTELQEIPFFLSVLFPQDRYVHYKDKLRIIGKISNMVSTLKVNNNPVYIDPSAQFAIPINLNPGKNNVIFDLTLDTKKENNAEPAQANDNNVQYSMRVLYLKSYPDLTPKTKGRREIEFLSTLDVIDGDDDGNFYPENPVTRAYITKLMVLAAEEVSPKEVSSALFSDVPVDHPYGTYIQAAIENGLIFAFPDGTFKPNQSLTLSEAIFLLSNAGLIEFTEIDSEKDTYVTRAELAEFLAYTPEYEQKIEQLINWNIGY